MKKMRRDKQMKGEKKRRKVQKKDGRGRRGERQ